ncbi:MAG TPA: magnesium-translocating P-type ATPase [Candidatus Paceibacterota bacterium]|nr:magnesium-translocating P-type ATPase [Candidatus Paceibacterota bacterium]
MLTEEDLKKYAAHVPVEILAALNSQENGLTEVEAYRRFSEYGPNEYAAKKHIRPFLILLSKFKSPVLLMLIAASAVSFFLDSRFEAYIIMAMVLVSAMVDFFNTYRSEQAVLDLEEQVKVTVAVMRDGKLKEKRVRDVVPGDIFNVVAGDLIPADSLVIEERDLFVNESSLTGESMPVEKGKGEGANILYMGTSVVSGEATAVAVVTGRNTKMGQIANRLQATETVSEFEKNLKDFSLFIFRVTLSLVLAILLLNILLKRSLGIETFLFAVAIAVGIAPEMLPMIVTANLARGAKKMSKNGVIVKNLSAIHNFGSIDIFCTDKTGTLTEDRISLIKYVDGLGAESRNVLFWGSLSAHYVSGIRRTLDNAIRDYAKDFKPEEWTKADEIPFDFERKMESVVVHRGNEIKLLGKGAPEEILKHCKTYGEKAERLSDDLLVRIKKEYEDLSAQGFRVLGVAIKNVNRRTGAYTKADEAEMTFLGYLAFMDPPKKSAKQTILKMMAHNVNIKIITGDNNLVTEMVARELGFPIHGVLSGDEIAAMGYQKLKEKVATTNIFARVNPEQKQEIVRALRENGHVVGFMGDGVNDVLALKSADVSISVNNATQIAKETADIILLRGDLGELIEGVVEGRRTFANIFKYLMMALSSNFGNMFSLPIASLFLPFLPMLPAQIILNNFLYDTSQLTIPWDNVSDEFVRRAKKFNLQFLRRFMMTFGPVSSVFDVTTFIVMYFGFRYVNASFQTAWFLESIATQTLVVLVIRRFGGGWSFPNPFLIFGTFGAVLAAWLLPFTPLADLFGLARLPLAPLLSIWAIVGVYLLAVELVKRWFERRYGHLIETAA